MKKIFALVLALALVFQGAGTGSAQAAVAEGKPLAYGRLAEKLPAFDPFVPEGDTASQSYAMAMARLAASLRTYDGSAERFQVTLDIPFPVPREDSYGYFDTLFLHTIREYPELFWVNLGDRGNLWEPESSQVTYTVRVFPEFTGEGLTAAQEALDKALQETVKQIFRPEMSDAEKVLSAYGWMNQYIQYDAKADWDAYSAYSGLVKRSAVCHGSAVTMGMLLKEAGVDCYTVLSHVEGEDMYHIWCAVQIGGQWYNLDPTAGYVRGYQGYGKFLRSKEEMLSGGSYVEDETRLHLECVQSYPGDRPWHTTNQSFLYSEEHKGLVYLENCIDLNGTVYLGNTAPYRVVNIDEEGRAVSRVIATIPACVKNATQAFEDHIYYLTYTGELRSFQISSSQDQSMGRSFQDLYVNLDEENRELMILDGQGAVQERIKITG